MVESQDAEAPRVDHLLRFRQVRDVLLRRDGMLVPDTENNWPRRASCTTG